MLTAAELHGIIPPLLTPLNPDETVDEPALRRLVSYVLDGGCQALFALGSSGEFCTLPQGQHRRVLETVVAVARELSGFVWGTGDRADGDLDARAGGRQPRRDPRGCYAPYSALG